MEMLKNCIVCNNQFSSIRKNRLFCSSACRRKSYKSNPIVMERIRENKRNYYHNIEKNNLEYKKELKKELRDII